jgi:MarR family 2-MHQ and catechol resistance regulon transcriptional repressor
MLRYLKGFKMENDAVHLWLILWKAYDTLREHAERHIRSLGLGRSDFGVLEVLLHKGPMPVNAIGSVVRLTSGSITVAVDRLVRKGLVERRNDPEDRRARVVHLTAQGRKLIECAFADHEAAMERATSGLTPVERREAAALLKKLGLQAQAMLPDYRCAAAIRRQDASQGS